jgi:hypothetical protein
MRIGVGFDLPECEVVGCELAAMFHGFGHDFCWCHYSKWITRFSLTPSPDTSTMLPSNPPLTIGENSVGHEGQMRLDLREEG